MGLARARVLQYTIIGIEARRMSRIDPNDGVAVWGTEQEKNQFVIESKRFTRDTVPILIVIGFLINFLKIFYMAA